MKPITIASDSYSEYDEDSSKKNPKFKVGDHVRISKYKNIFANWYTPNWSEEVFIINKIKNVVPWTYSISDLNGEKIIGSIIWIIGIIWIYEKELQKANLEKFRIEKIIKRKGNKLYVKCKWYDNSFNSWFDKKDII